MRKTEKIASPIKVVEKRADMKLAYNHYLGASKFFDITADV
jgi:hypothetical protein